MSDVSAALPKLVLLPGMDGTGDLFGPLLAAFGTDVDVQVVRYPVSQPLAYAELEALVRTLLPVDRPFVLLGESFSGPIAVSIAARPPANLAGLVLCCTFASNPRPGLAWMAPLAACIPFGRLPTEPALAALLGRDTTPALRGAVGAAIRSVSTHVLQARLKAVFGVDVRAALQAIRVPVLSVRASDDWLLPLQASADLLRGAPATEEVIGGPHCLLQASPLEAAAVLTRFLRRC